MLLLRVPETRSNLVARMSRSVCAALLGPEFDGFLYAQLGEERNGMPLSVLSALAQLQVDPWQKAARLARLPAGNRDREVGRVDCFTAERSIAASRSRLDRCSLGRTPAVPLEFRYRSPQDVDRRQEATPLMGCHIHVVDDPCVGYGMDRGWPSTIRTYRKYSYTGFRYNLSAGTPELWLVTNKPNTC